MTLLESTIPLSEHLRPTTLADCALPRRLKDPFTTMLHSERIMNMLFYGAPGTGKTTVARLLAGQGDAFWNALILNGSLDNDVRTMEGKVQQFATSMSMVGGMKVCLVDEADYLTPNAQAILRGVIEATSANCRFLFTANYPKKIIDPLQSRLKPLCFDLLANERDEVIAEYVDSLLPKVARLGIQMDRRELLHNAQLHFPDYRAIANAIELKYWQAFTV